VLRPARTEGVDLDVQWAGSDGSRDEASLSGGDAVTLTRWVEAGTEAWIRCVGAQHAAPLQVTAEVQPIGDQPLAAGDGASAEMWGVFVGVSEYENGRDNLPNCDDDATNMVRALEPAGGLRPDHAIVLTNADATRGAIQAALAGMETRVGTEDSFVFFFSGHGGQSGGEDLTELDRLDEFICPHDSDHGGDVFDDELDAWLARIRTALTLVFLDACNSGGFRDELARRRGRVILLASEEDLLSYTYEERKSGGILAHTLLRAFRGEGDLDGDGEITAGELSDFVLTQMPTIGISDDDHVARLAQHPVSSRTVPYETILVRLAP
jgi:hypothetical protein